MKRPRRKKELSTEINITNLVDVIMAILIMFMMTAPLMTKGIRVDLPKANAASMQDKKNVTVSLDSTGALFVAAKPSNLEQLSGDLSSAWDGQSPVFIQSDSKVPYGTVAKLMAALRQAGVQKIGFMTQNEAKL